MQRISYKGSLNLNVQHKITLTFIAKKILIKKYYILMLGGTR
jgi:hypothetical protein